MGMLKNINLENYKCFRNNTDIKIAPLTIICGVNSSGKSSIIKSLLMLKQSAESKLSDTSIMLSGDLVDCGDFEDVVNDEGCSSNNFFKIENEFSIKNHKLHKIGKYVKREDAQAFNELRRLYSNISGEISEFRLKIRLTIQKRVDDHNAFLSHICNNCFYPYEIIINAIDLEGKEMDSCRGSIRMVEAGDGEHHLLSWDNMPGFSNACKSFENYKCVCSFSGLSISNIFAYNMPNRVKNIVPNILTISRIVSNQYNSIFYIAPLRNVPARTYLIKGNVDSVGVSGDDTATLLAKIKDSRVTTDMVCPFNNGLKTDQHGFIETDYLTVIQQWLSYFEVEELEVKNRDRVINVKVGQHNITDVGFGVSQLLPILVQGIYMDKEQQLIVEQPEIHLHPKLELCMADFLLHAATKGRQVLIETHSDHLVNRVVHRMMEDPSLCAGNDPIVRIIFLDRDSTSAVNKIDINVDPYRGVTNGSVNFFTQFATETCSIAKTGFDNYERDNP